jgi:1,4-alpha-glucan branching enzyme
MTNNTLMPLVQADEWLLPVNGLIQDRTDKFKNRLKNIENDFGSLEHFASAYEYYGLNYSQTEKGWWYREWAPRAKQLFIFGDFNNWELFSLPLTKNEFGVWEIFLSDINFGDAIQQGSKVKVIVDGNNGEHVRIPAYIKRVIQDDKTKNYDGQFWKKMPYKWEDKDFKIDNSKPLLIYESHVGMAQEKQGIGSYNEFTKNILPYIKSCGYNVIQLMAIQEHPYYGSFGYHVSNFFAVSSRFGTPEELKNLINEAHKLGIAVIMDIVHSHSVKNFNEGINEFDGSEDMYFHAGERGLHPEWDSKLFDYGKTEVLRFLLSNVKYWMDEFHFDGFRFDGVGSMMYFHHGLNLPDTPEKFFSDGVETDAITYLQLANQLCHQINPNAITIAEDVTGMPGLTSKITDGGLGFNYRLGMGLPDFWIKLIKEVQDENWDLEWIWHVLNDRKAGVKTVCYAESHDQALVGDKTLAFRLMDKHMYTSMSKTIESIEVDRGIALLKIIRLLTITLGGNAYLNFMGNEFAHPEWIDFPRVGNRWSYKYARRQWSLVKNDNLKYEYLAEYDKALLDLVKENNLLDDSYGYKLGIDNDNKTLIFQKHELIFIVNIHPDRSIMDYKINVPNPGKYQLLFSTEPLSFGGSDRLDKELEYFTTEDNDKHLLSIYNVNRAVQVFRLFNNLEI